MKHMKAAILLLILLLCLPLGASASAAQGQADQTVEFYVYAQADTTLTFTQTKGVLLSGNGLKNTAYGGYDITWYPAYQPSAAKTVSFSGKTAAVRVNRGVNYVFRVVPYTMDRLTARDAYLGLPGAYQRWTTLAAWTLADNSRCTVSAAPVQQVTATPAPQSATVPVYYRLSDGTLISAGTERLSAGTHVLTSKLNSSYYTLISSPYQTVTVSASGVASPSSVTFYFQANSGGWNIWNTATATPVPTAAPQSATVTVYYRLSDGSLIYYTTEKLSPGTHVITSKLNNSYFSLISSPYQTVTVSASGVASPSSVTFYYQYSSIWGGVTAKPTAVPTQKPTATPVPAARNASVPVYCRLTDGTLLTSRVETLAPGTHVVYGNLNSSYFTPSGQSYQVVSVSAAGIASPSSVTFYYRYVGAATAAPVLTPVPTAVPTAVPRVATLQVYYKLTDGTLLYQETRQLAEGAHMISYDNRFAGIDWLSFSGPGAYQVSVSSSGLITPTAITFYFVQKNGGGSVLPTVAPTATLIPVYDEAATDQEATIGTAKIYPRPKPGKGKNTFNYEAIGQKVTVHSKARSLTGDGTWWVCISANLKCWGKYYVIDHEWINVTYLNQRSFDLDLVPLDPNYS